MVELVYVWVVGLVDWNVGGVGLFCVVGWVLIEWVGDWVGGWGVKFDR